MTDHDPVAADLALIEGDLYGVSSMEYRAAVKRVVAEYRALVARCEQAEAEFAVAQVSAADARRDHLRAMKRAEAAEADLAALREQHAEAVEAAFRAGYASRGSLFSLPENVDAAWSSYQQERASTAKARLT